MEDFPRRPRFFSRKRVWLPVALLLALPSAGEAELRLGHLAFSHPPARELENPIRLREGLKSFDYLTNVGGVAFGGVAVPAGGYRVARLAYDPGRPDGRRLQVTLADETGARRTVTAAIYDWHLVPIARYASRDQHACFTLFGRLMDDSEERARKRRGEKILNYHPAFADTLLGLRLFQSDILILDSAAADLPCEGGRPLLGAGERPPEVDANLDRLIRVQESMRGMKESRGGIFSSYVICDEGQRITFGVAAKELVITGHPFWHLWRYRTRDPAAFRKIQEKANEEGNRIILEEMNRDRQALPRMEYVEKYTRDRAQARFEQIVRGILSETAVEEMPSYSKLLSEEIRLADGVNPAVYDSLVKTMRYAAFFRHVRIAAPAVFADFLASLKGVKIEPQVKTPTAMSEAKER